MAQQAKDAEKAKKKAAKKANSTDEEPAAETEKDQEAEDIKIINPKVKISVEFSRSGYMQVTKATVGIKDSRQSFINVKHVRKDSQLSEDMIRQAKNRMKWYQKRDEDKIKTDISKNEFES